MTREELEALSKAELKEHAEVSGIALGALDTKGTMVDKILGEYTAPAAKAKPQHDTAQLPPEHGGLYTLAGEKVEGRRYKLKIFASQGDSSDVDLIVNCHNLRVRRGVEVIVQEPYVDLLRNAMIETVVQDPDTGIRTPQQIQVYPFSAELIA